MLRSPITSEQEGSRSEAAPDPQQFSALKEGLVLRM